MKIELIFPYIRRLLRVKSELTAKVVGSESDISEKLKPFDLFKNIYPDNGTAETNYDLIVVDVEKLIRDDTWNELWNKLADNGWIVFNGKENDAIHEVIAFRKSLKITSALHRMDDVIFFQKENYSNRFDAPVELQQMPNDIDMDDFVPVPNWNDSHLKDEYLLQYGNGDVFVETGTYLGQTVELVRRSLKDWRKIYSVELDLELGRRAKLAFDFDSRIDILRGDSVDKITEICNNEKLNEKPATFWLDAHASGPLPGGNYGPCPLIDELKAIQSSGRIDHTIMIDDRRLFGSREWNELKEEDVLNLLKEINPNYNILYLNGQVPKDILCATVVDNGIAITREKQRDDVELPNEVAKFFGVDNQSSEPDKKEPEKPKLIFL